MGLGLAERIEAVFALDANSHAMEFKGRWHTWGEIGSVMAQVEGYLAQAALPKGTPVGVLLRNRPAHVAALLQVLVSHRCVVTINPFQGADKLADDLRKIRAPALIAASEDLEIPQIRAALEDIGSLTIALDSKDELQVRGILPMAEAPAIPFHEPLPGTCILMLTSGTTGPAKRIKLPYRNFERALLDAAHYEQSRDPNSRLKLKTAVAVINTPLVHIGGMYAAVDSIVSARPISILEKFSVDEWQRTMLAYRPKLVSLPPTAIRMVFDADVPKDVLASLLAIRTGSAPLDTELQHRFESKYGVPILDTYGATEFAGAVAGWTLRDHREFGNAKRGSVGRAQPGCELRIVNLETGEPHVPGTVGLLEVRSPQIDAKAWLRTTDLAEIDSDGFLFIRGRADDAIIRGGFKVLPIDIETVLRRHPSVKEACVVGLPEARLGAVPVAAVEQSADSPAVSGDDLIAFARNHLVAYQVPVRIEVVDTLPRTPSLKISRYEVKNLFEALPASKAPD
ncbi:acyl--CoA ligase [Burkholderia sp. R-69980]|nr:acyl--CoA ligase [Burkholderia sp. R-69980]